MTPVAIGPARTDIDDLAALDFADWGELPGVPKACELHEQVAAVHAQLAPISSRAALLDSFRRESLSLLAPTWPEAEGPNAAPAVVALEIAYALRWRELPDALPTEPESAA